MSIYKRGKVYWYKFRWNGELIRESTKQRSDRVARTIESAHRTSLAKGEVGLREKKKSLSLKTFTNSQFVPWAEATFASKLKTWLWYRNGVRRLLEFPILAECKIEDIAGEHIASYVASRRSAGLQTSSINRELQVLRRILNLAMEWGAVARVAKVRMLGGERHREFVISAEEQARYLAAAPEPLASVASILGDTGLRPEESYRLRWENINWRSGTNGSLSVTHGKTAAARRVLPMTIRVRKLLLDRWQAVGEPSEGWVWPAPTRSGHLEASSLRKQHARAFRLANARARSEHVKPIRIFVLYAFRHTYLTRLGESGCDVWTLARVAGHSSIAMSHRYVHPSETAVLAAMSRLGGHNIGHIGQDDKTASPNPIC